MDRAGAVAPDFELAEANAPALARLCRRLDGMPLAIELAAARARVLSVEQISTRLDESFDLLTGNPRTTMARQRTLGAAMDWSHDLLSREEMILFRRLSVFAGGFTLEAAERVFAGEGIEYGEILELLSHLVDKSLVMVAERDSAARYEEIMHLLRRLQDKTGTAYGLRGMACVAALRADATRSAVLWGAAEALGEASERGLN
jgi:predicted ATPase